MYVTKDENTIDYFHRFKKIKVVEEITNIDRTWQVCGVNPYFGDGIVEVFLDEYFENRIEEAAEIEKQEIENQKKVILEDYEPQISGPTRVAAYDIATYAIHNIGGGKWYISEDGVEELFNETDSEITIEIVKGKMKPFTLIYRTDDADITLDVEIDAF